MADGNSKGWTFDTFETWVLSVNEERAQALEAAFEAAKEKSDSHNRLIEAMERQQATFITKGQVYAALIASLTALSIAVGMYAAFGSS